MPNDDEKTVDLYFSDDEVLQKTFSFLIERLRLIEIDQVRYLDNLEEAHPHGVPSHIYRRKLEQLEAIRVASTRIVLAARMLGVKIG